MPAIAITDHGVAQSFPDAWHTGEGKIKLLYGCEGYFLNNIDDRICVHGPQDGDFSTEICCFDIETTGLKVAHDAITEIGAVILKDGEIVDTFQTFVDPERRLSPEIIGLTGITDDMLRGAPKLEDALHAFWPLRAAARSLRTMRSLISASSAQAAKSAASRSSRRISTR